MSQDKVPLQDLFPDYQLMTVRECLGELGWAYEDEKEGPKNVKCCGELVYVGGWVGPEHAHCKVCDKGIQDVTGILPHPAMKDGAGVCQHIDYDKTEIPEDGRVWIPVRCW